MSDTPRTDALLLEINEGRIYDADSPTADLCRTLERELAQIQSKLDVEETVSNRLRISWREDTEELQSKLDKTHNFLVLCLREINPDIESIDTLENTRVQVSHVMWGQKERIASLEAELKTERENGAKLRHALQRFIDWDSDMLGDEYDEKYRDSRLGVEEEARAALGSSHADE